VYATRGVGRGVAPAARMWTCRCGHTSCERVAQTRTQVTAELACEGCGRIYQRASPGAPLVLFEGDYIGSYIGAKDKEGDGRRAVV